MVIQRKKVPNVIDRCSAFYCTKLHVPRYNRSSQDFSFSMAKKKTLLANFEWKSRSPAQAFIICSCSRQKESYFVGKGESLNFPKLLYGLLGVVHLIFQWWQHEVYISPIKCSSIDDRSTTMQIQKVNSRSQFADTQNQRFCYVHTQTHTCRLLCRTVCGVRHF